MSRRIEQEAFSFVQTEPEDGGVAPERDRNVKTKSLTPQLPPRHVIVDEPR